MISVQFKMGKKLSLIIKGHAGEGKDIICASASILAYTLAQNLKDRKDLCDKVTLRLKEGNTEISCTPKDGSWVAIRALYNAFIRGLDLLEANYPDNISVQRIIPKHK